MGRSNPCTQNSYGPSSRITKGWSTISCPPARRIALFTVFFVACAPCPCRRSPPPHRSSRHPHKRSAPFQTPSTKETCQILTPRGHEACLLCCQEAGNWVLLEKDGIAKTQIRHRKSKRLSAMLKVVSSGGEREERGKKSNLTKTFATDHEAALS